MFKKTFSSIINFLLYPFCELFAATYVHSYDSQLPLGLLLLIMAMKLNYDFTI